MRKFLLASVISTVSLAALAEPVKVQQIPAGQVEPQANASVYQKQTVVRYNVPTCKNCQTTTTVSRTVNSAEPVVATVPCQTCNNTCTTCGTVVAAAPAPKAKSCVYNNHKYAINNPLFVLKEGQFSSDTIAGYHVTPKKIDWEALTIRPRWDTWEVGEQIMYGVTDWLSFKLQGGYSSFRPKKSTWNLIDYDQNGDPVKGTPVPHHYSYEGTVGLRAHALDFCNFDLIVGVDATWGRAGERRGDCDTHTNFAIATPYAIIGAQVSKYITPYLQASYNFVLHGKSESLQDEYILEPGIYIQPSRYFAIHPYMTKVEHENPIWRLAFDFYPYQNLVIGIEGTAKGISKDPMDSYGIAGRVKMTF